MQSETKCDECAFNDDSVAPHQTRSPNPHPPPEHPHNLTEPTKILEALLRGGGGVTRLKSEECAERRFCRCAAAINTQRIASFATSHFGHAPVISNAHRGKKGGVGGGADVEVT